MAASGFASEKLNSRLMKLYLFSPTIWGPLYALISRFPTSLGRDLMHAKFERSWAWRSGDPGAEPSVSSRGFRSEQQSLRLTVYAVRQRLGWVL